MSGLGGTLGKFTKSSENGCTGVHMLPNVIAIMMCLCGWGKALNSELSGVSITSAQTVTLKTRSQNL